MPLDVEKLLAPVSNDAPCGENLEYDPAYLELDRLANGTPEQVVGTSVIPAVEPDWKGVRERCTELLARTRDLRIVSYLTLSLLQLQGLPGFRDGLVLLKKSVDQFWDCLYPQLDPDDGNDPTERMNILRVFASRDMDRGDSMGVKLVRLAPLTDSRMAGRFSLRDMGIASGAIPPANPEAPKLEMSLIEAAAKDSSPEFLQMGADAAKEAAALVREIEATIDAKVGAGRGVDMTDLARTLDEAAGKLGQFLGLHGIAPPSDGAAATPGGDGAAAGLAGGPVAPRAAITGDIQSNADVIRMIEKICDYYARVEPSSPVPILLKRAQRLVGKNFWDILNDLSPSAIETVKVISGETEQASS